MKTFLKSLPILGPFVREIRWRYRFRKVDPTRHLRNILRHQKEVFIIQIGSNDGVTGDPIHSLLRQNPSWRALLIEPVPFLFERLKRNYARSENVQFDNVAVSDTVGTTIFHYVDPKAKQHLPDLPIWFDQLGSFDREHIIRQLGNELESFIVSEEVSTLPLAAVLARNHITRIDALHIDTEGCDWAILRQLDMDLFRPQVILFEHHHLSEDDRRAAVAFVTAGSYRISDLGGDYLCERV